MYNNANMTGGLFSPIPAGTALTGNIRCESDTTRLVLGFVEVSTTTRLDRYIWERDWKMYEPPLTQCYSRIIDADANTRLFISTIPPKTASPESCLDCRAHPHASKVKPEGWPTDDI
jgi:hypothetical protein